MMRKQGCALLLAAALLLVPALPAEAAVVDFELESASVHFGDGGYTENGREVRGFIEDFGRMANTRPGTEIFMPLRTRDFEWGEGSYKPSMTAEGNRVMDLGLALEYHSSAEAFETIDVTSRDGQLGLLIRFAAFYPYIEPLEFDVACAFTLGGGLIPDAEFAIRGDLRNYESFVYQGAKTATLGVGRMATGYSDLYGITFDLGGGVTMTGDLLWAETVYGHAGFAQTDADRALMATYPAITQAVRLQTVGLRGNVSFDTGGAGVLHVYDGDLKYLGTTEQPVRFRSLYYLSTAPLA